jgi:hypothetical protein
MKLINHFHISEIKGPATAADVAVPSEMGLRRQHNFDIIAKVPKRIVVEVCCGPNSLLGEIARKECKDCSVYCITEHDDFRSENTLNRCISLCKPGTLVFLSLPCTGGSRWYNINKHKPGGIKRHKAHVRLFRQLLSKGVRLIEHALNSACLLILEWPKSCEYWKYPCVTRLMDRYALRTIDFDGCMFGLTSIHNGLPIKKPWTFATNSDWVRKSRTVY